MKGKLGKEKPKRAPPVTITVRLSKRFMTFFPSSGAFSTRLPRDDLIQHVVNGLFLCWTGFEDAEVFEVGIQREQDLIAHGGHLHLASRKGSEAGADPSDSQGCA